MSATHAFNLKLCHMCVCLCVCSLLRFRLNVFLPPLPEIGCPKLFYIQNPWGKTMHRSDFRFKKTFTNEGCKIAAPTKKMGEFFLNEQDFFGIGVSHSV